MQEIKIAEKLRDSEINPRTKHSVNRVRDICFLSNSHILTREKRERKYADETKSTKYILKNRYLL